MRVLLTGASGQLGAYLASELERRGERVVAWAGRGEVDLTDGDALADAFRAARPQVVLHTAALSKPALCYHEPHEAEQVNVVATRRLAELADEAGARLVLTSTDMVFDGERGMYSEEDAAEPAMVYGRMKREAEGAVLAMERGMVARLSLLFGPGRHGRETLFDKQLAAMRAGEGVRLFDDEWRTPLALPLAAEALAEACGADAAGLFHLGGPERVSRLELGRMMAEAVGADEGCLQACSRLSVEAAEPRPRDLSLRTTRWREQIGGRAVAVGVREAVGEMLRRPTF